MIARVIGRVLWLAISFLVAVGLALAVLLLLGALWLGDELRYAYPNDPMMRHAGDWYGALLFTVTVAPTLTILPAMVAVVVGEVLHFRSWMYYVLAGGLALVAIPLLTGTPAGFASLPASQVTAIFATAGFTGGLVYWIMAGRTA